MEVLKSGDCPAVVTNIEVMNILSKRIDRRYEDACTLDGDQEKRVKGDPKLRHRDFIEEKVLEYLQTTPCVNADIKQMPELISKLMGDKSSTNSPNKGEEIRNCRKRGEANDGYKLLDAEILQVLNLMPKEKVEAHLMIEQLETRMDDDRQDQLLQLISEYSGVIDEPMEEEEIIEEEL